MKKYVIDSCVFNKLFLDEEDRQLAIDFITQINNNEDEILVPEIFYFEVLQTACYYKYDGKEIHKMLQDFEANNLHIIKTTPELIEKACEITKIGHEKSGFPSFYNSVYHALAIENNCDFITVDKKHYDKVKHIGNITFLNEI